MSSNKSTGLKRNTIDKFYTSPDTVQTCIQCIKDTIAIQPGDLCIEPSAGNGAFIPEIKLLSNHSMFYDLEPGHDEIKKQDYLTLEDHVINGQKIHIIGNPPFGRQSSLAIRFIKKSAMFCHSICFILPKSFKKDSLKKHFPLSFHLVHEYEIPEKSFTIDNKPHDVPCVFQIWIRKDIPRSIIKKLTPNKYKFVKKDEEHHISFRRVGIHAGDIDRETNEKSIQSHYFIKFDNAPTDKLIKSLSSITYDCKHNTCGPKSISKQELIKEFNNII